MADKAWYWIALGVLVFGLNHGFENGRSAMSTLADRSASLVDQLTGPTMQYLALAQAEIGMHSAQFQRVHPAMAKVQSNLACVQASIARRQTDLALRRVNVVRLQRERIRDVIIDTRGLPTPPVPQMPNDDTI